MNLEALEQEVEARNQEADSLAKRLETSANLFVPVHKYIIKEDLKKRLIADIFKMVRQVLEDIETNEEDLRRNLEFDRNVCVHGFRFESSHRLEFRVASRQQPDSETLRLERVVLAKDFRSRLDFLVSSIEQGAMDEELDMIPAEAIWLHVLNVGQHSL